MPERTFHIHTTDFGVLVLEDEAEGLVGLSDRIACAYLSEGFWYRDEKEGELWIAAGGIISVRAQWHEAEEENEDADEASA